MHVGESPRIRLLGTETLVVAAHEIGILLRDGIAVDGDDGFAGAETRKLLGDAALDDAKRIDDLLLENAPLRFAGVAFLLGAPGAGLLADARDIET